MNMLPINILHEILCYLDREGLEKISICNRQFSHIVTKYFPTRPFRYLKYLRIDFIRDEAVFVMKPDDFTDKIPIMKDVTFYNNADGKITVYPSRFLPYLKHQTIRVAENIIQVYPRMAKKDKELLIDIAHIWRNSDLHINIKEFPQSGYDTLLKELFNSIPLTTTAKLTLNTEVTIASEKHFCTNTALVRLCDHPQFYDCSSIDICLVLLQVEDIVEFVHSIPFHRQNQLTIQFLSGDKCYFALVFNLDKFIHVVEACKQRFLNAETPTSYAAYFEFFDAMDEPTPESILFQAVNRKTREQLELTDIENNGLKFMLRRFAVNNQP
ncbi:hypothetical protein DdX_16540 [Ditylenchus destructor]|uniref:F-box domain-containing protein n=1 Tax=Ditylenchus destructor TaxID=166010 RepID=A0AAD4QZT3_9BILA|nr:hypothetical protein DdX_16540 [Ditylenchus destructor]